MIPPPFSLKFYGHNFDRRRHYGACVRTSGSDAGKPQTAKIAMMIRTHIRAAAFALTTLAAAGWSGTALAQMDPSDAVVRIDQLERQIRQLTGSVEQLQFRNQQLEQQMKRMQDDTEYRLQELSRGGARSQPSAQAQRPGQIAQPQPGVNSPAAPLTPPTQQQLLQQGRGDVFDPGQNPSAPGAPRPLGVPGRRSEVAPQANGAIGSLPSGNDRIGTVIMSEEPQGGGQIGIPGGRDAGAPLDLATMSRSASAGDNVAASPGGNYQRSGAAPLPQGYPQQQAVSPQQAYPQQQQAAAQPSPTARDEYDAAYSFMLRKDYAAAEDNLRAFVAKYPRDKLVPDAQFWIGESEFQRQQYREAADAFVAMSKKYENHAKAPDALLRLGQSLAALNEKELACATFGEVERKYPRASKSVKQTIERELKRVRC
jgi:tol-pal system protein YbgF